MLLPGLRARCVQRCQEIPPPSLFEEGFCRPPLPPQVARSSMMLFIAYLLPIIYLKVKPGPNEWLRGKHLSPCHGSILPRGRWGVLVRLKRSPSISPVCSLRTCMSGALQRDGKPSDERLGAKKNTNQQHLTLFKFVSKAGSRIIFPCLTGSDPLRSLKK